MMVQVLASSSFHVMGPKCLVEIWADVAIQRQLLATGGKQNICKNIATNLNDSSCKRNAQPKFNIFPLHAGSREVGLVVHSILSKNFKSS